MAVIDTITLKSKFKKGDKPTEQDFADLIDTLHDVIPASLPASDVSEWAKAPTKPTYTATEVGAYTKSEIDTQIQTLVAADATKANTDAVYSKAEVDLKLSTVSAYLSNYYTKAEIDNQLGDVNLALTEIIGE